MPLPENEPPDESLDRSGSELDGTDELLGGSGSELTGSDEPLDRLGTDEEPDSLGGPLLKELSPVVQVISSPANIGPIGQRSSTLRCGQWIRGSTGPSSTRNRGE